MKRLLATSVFLLSGFLASMASALGGFEYGNSSSPQGDEWNNPTKLGYNKEQPRAHFFTFQDVESARKVLPENSRYWQSLNGTWAFHWVPNPDSRPKNFYETTYDASAWDKVKVPMNWNMYGVQKNGDLKYGVPIYVNLPVIFHHKIEVDDWKGGVMREPAKNWTTYKYRNEVGSYRRTFTIPENWDGREVFVAFDGVDSFFYLWINGKYAGFSKNSRNTARFNVTKYLNKGENLIAVEVYRSSDGSFLESQDMFRLPGIFRGVALYSTPKLQIRDLQVTPELDKAGQNGSLSIKTFVHNYGKKEAKKFHIDYTLYANELYSDNNTPVNASATVAVQNIKAGAEQTGTTTINLTTPKQWSAEAPYRYTLVAQLKDAKNNTVETVSTIVGFRKVEIKETPASEDEFGLAGRYFYVNGKTVKLKGVNRHETNPELGHAITREQMREEVMMMKRANINHVRTSHYTNDPYWYFLCNKYGIYLESEANVESHEYHYGKASLSHPKEWENAHVARIMEMAHAYINDPSIVIWSLGNEAGPGHNFVVAYDSLKKFDPSRPVQYERNNNIVDMGSNQYPSVIWVREAVKGNYDIKYPFHISEYAHSMGNACGNLVDYMEAMESTNFFCGAAIWDWIDQAMYNYDPKTGERYMAYGGDFGDWPNDGQFVMNGIIFADLTPKPQYYEVKKVYQNIKVEALDIKTGKISIFNKQYFESLADYNCRWSLWCNGKEIKNGSIDNGRMAAIGPRQKAEFNIPLDYDQLKNECEYFVKLQFTQKNGKPWAKAGFVQAEEQMLVKTAAPAPTISKVAEKGNLVVDTTNQQFIHISGKDFKASFNRGTGTLHQLTYNGTTIIPENCGPKLDALRAFVNNDNWSYGSWFENGLHNLRHTAGGCSIQTDDGKTTLSFTVTSQAPFGSRIRETHTASGHYEFTDLKDQPFGQDDFRFITNLIWTVYADGSIELQSAITSNKPALILPRLGFVMELPKTLDKLTYYGRGPIDNYNDRRTSQNIEVYQTDISREMNNWPKPQNCGNHEEVRWCAVTDKAGNGAAFIADTPMAIQALPNSSMDMIQAPHTYQLPKRPHNFLHLDAKVTGLGGNSCGQGGPLVEDRVMADNHHFAFIIRPVKADNLERQVNVSVSDNAPLIISRSRDGKVSIKGKDASDVILYRTTPAGQQSVNKAKNKKAAKKVSALTFTEPFAFAEGGTVTAWKSTTPQLTYTMQFNRLETFPVEVVNVSSEETGDDEGLAKHLTDGDAGTYWHTIYSVTVAKHPHWIEFDAGNKKKIKGFTWLPRQDSSNGNVKDYRIHVSMDGKNWGDPVAEGSFENNRKEKRIMLPKTIEGRFVRFTALNAHDGHDFATGAEFQMLSE